MRNTIIASMLLAFSVTAFSAGSPEQIEARTNVFYNPDLTARILGFLEPTLAPMLVSKRKFVVDDSKTAQESPYGVCLKDGSWAFIQQITFQNRFSEFRPYDLLLAVEVTPNDDLSYILRNETIEAAESGIEPEYLQDISSMLKIKLAFFLWEKEKNLTTKEDWQKHAHSLFFSIKAFYVAAHGAARGAALVAGDLPGGPGFAAWDAADNAAMRADFYAAHNAAWSSIWEDVDHMTEFEAEALASALTKSELLELNLTDHVAIGNHSYRFAEKVALLYFLKNAEKSLNFSYNASMSELTSLPENDDFESSEKWNRFKNEHLKFKGVNIHELNAYHFLRPWIDELDRIILEIDSRT